MFAKTRAIARKYGPRVAAVPALALVAVGSAMADSTAAVAAVTTAQTDALAVVSAIVAMGVAIWGGMIIYRKFFR